MTGLCQNEYVPSEELVECEDGVVQNAVLYLMTRSLPYTNSIVNFTSGSRRKRIGTYLVDEITVHSWRANLGVPTCWSAVTTYQEGDTFVPFHMDCHMNKIQWLLRLRVMYRLDVGVSGKCWMLRP